MDQYKSILASKTVWGVIFMIVGAIFQWSPDLTDQAATVATDLVSAVLQGIGAVLALYGRIKAEKQIQL